jgi:mRNA interferase MazF
MSINPQRGEIWNLDFAPQVGAEIAKIRPALVLDHGHPSLTLRIVVPITGWQPSYAKSAAKINIQPSSASGLTKESAADAYQIKTADLCRFQNQIGKLPQPTVDDVASAVATLIDAP